MPSQRIQPDLVILGRDVAGEDGLPICRRLYAHERFPILMWCSKADEIDRVVVLETGATTISSSHLDPRAHRGAARNASARARTQSPLSGDSPWAIW